MPLKAARTSSARRSESVIEGLRWWNWVMWTEVRWTRAVGITAGSAGPRGVGAMDRSHVEPSAL
jgi:hypothetical protein